MAWEIICVACKELTHHSHNSIHLLIILSYIWFHIFFAIPSLSLLLTLTLLSCISFSSSLPSSSPISFSSSPYLSLLLPLPLLPSLSLLLPYLSLLLSLPPLSLLLSLPRSINNSPPSSYPTGSSQDKVPPLVTPTISLTQTLCDPIWGEPPAPSRLFADVVKRKQPPEPSLVDSPKLTPIVSATPPRKLMRKVSSPVTSEPPSPVSVSLPASPIPSSPASTVDTVDTDDVAVWDDTQTDDESFDWASSFPSSQGPLSSKEICKFLKIVKARKKPLEVARKFTSNISGLVRQLRPLRNSPLFTKSTQQRIYKLIKNLDI